MANENNIQLGFTADTTDAEQGIGRVETRLGLMAQKAEQAGQKSSKAIDGIGAGGAASAGKVDSATRSIIGSIQRTTAIMEAGERGSAKYYEALAAQRGVSVDALKPYITQLEAVKAKQDQASAALNVGAGSMNNAGLSAKQMANNLRMVPAQMTDIVTSLQGGQKPLTVLIQQGGQLKDIFGGIGPAAKAMGGYIMGLVNPFTIAAAAAVGLGVAMASINSKDAALLELSIQLTGTGRASVAAVGDVKLLIAELNKVPGISKSTATAILGEFAKVHGIGGEMFRSLGASVANFAAATGTDLPTAAKKLATAFADPAKGAKDLEESLGTLTAAQILTIEKMAAMGDKSGAQLALMEALKTSTQGLADQAMTPLGRSTENLSNAWDGLTTAVGKSDAFRSANNWLASLISNVAELTTKLANVRPPDWLKHIPYIGTGISAMGALGSLVGSGSSGGATGAWNEGGASGSFAPSTSDLERQVKSALDATNAYTSQTGAMDKLKATAKQAKDALKELEAQNKGTGIEATTLRDRISGINEKLAEMAKKAAGPAAKVDPLVNILKGISERTAASKMELDQDQKLTAGQKEAVKVLDALRTGTLKLTDSKAVLLGKGLEEMLQAEAVTGMRTAERQATEEASKERQKYIDGLTKDTASLEDQIRKQQDQNASIGMTKEAISALTAQRELDKASVLEAQALYVLEKQNDVQKYEAIMAQVDAMRKLAKEQARGGALQTVADEAKKAEAEWTKFYDSIYNGLTDSLYRAFEKGGSFFKSFWDGIKNMFKTTVLKLAIQGVVGGVTGLAANAASASGYNGFSTSLSAANSANTMYSAATGYSSGVNTMAGMMGAGGTAGASGASLAYANGVGMVGGDSMGALIAANAQWAGVAAGSATAAEAAIAANVAMEAGTGVALASGTTAAAAGGTAAAGASTSVLAAVPVYGWIALAVIAAYAIFSGGKDPASQSTGDSTTNYDPIGHRTGVNSSFGGASAQTLAQTDALYMAYATASANLGIEKVAATFGSGGNSDGTTTHFALSSGAGSKRYQTADNTEFSTAAYSLEASRAVLAALQGSDLPRYLSGVFDNITASSATQDEINNVIAYASALKSFDAALQLMPFENLKGMAYATAQSLISVAGGLEALQTKLSNYFQNYYTAEEQRAQTIKNINAATAGSGLDAATATRESFRALVEAQDVTTASGQNTYVALLNVADAFAGITPVVEAAATAVETISDAMKKLQVDTASLQIELMRAQGNTSGANTAQYAIDTTGLTKAERDVFDYNAALRLQITTLNDAAAEHTGLQDQLDQLTMTSTQLLDKQREALDGSNQALFDQVQAVTAAKAVAAERTGLQDQLDQLTMTSAQLLTKQRDALDGSNQALFDQIQTLQAAKTAAQAATEAAATYAAAMQSMLNAAVSAAAGAVSDAERGVSTARAGIKAAYDRDVAALNDQTSANAFKVTSDRFAGIAKQFRDFGESLAGALDTPAHSFDRLKSEYARLSDMARLGDSDAASRATSVGAALKDSIIAKSGTRTEADRELAKLANATALTAAIADTQVSVADAQLAALEDSNKIAKKAFDDQMRSFGILEDKSQSIVDAIKEFASASMTLDTVRNAHLAAVQASLSNQIIKGANGTDYTLKEVSDHITRSVTDAASAYATVIDGVNNYGVNPVVTSGAASTIASTTPAGSEASTDATLVVAAAAKAALRLSDIKHYLTDVAADTTLNDQQKAWNIYGAAGQYGATQAEAAAAYGWTLERTRDWFAGYGIPQFEAGGDHSGGLRIVGERGIELEATGPSRIFNASQTRDILQGGGNNNAELAQALRDMADRLDRIEANTRATAGHTAGTDRKLARVIPGNALITEAAV